MLEDEGRRAAEGTTALNRRAFLAALGGALVTGCAGARATVRTFPEEPAPAGLAVIPRAPGMPEPLLFTNVRVLDTEAGRLVPVHGVLLRGGRIAEVFERAPAPLSLDARRVDLRGDVLAPGFIDAHVHATMAHLYSVSGFLFHMPEQVDRNLACFVEHGVTTVRDMCAAPRLLARRIAGIARGDIPGPRVVRCDSIVQVPGGYPRQLAPLPEAVAAWTGQPMIWAKTPQEGRDAVLRLHDQGATVVKLAFDELPFTMNKDPIPVMDDRTAEAIRDQASRLSMTVACHHTHLSAARKAARIGVDTLEHLARDGEYTDDDLRAFQAARLAVVPTMSVGISLTWEQDEPTGDPLVREAIERKLAFFDRYADRFLVPAARKETRRLMGKYLADDFSAKERNSADLFDGRIFARLIAAGTATRNMARLREAGIPIGCGTDAGTPFNYAGNLALELYLLVRFGGMTPAEALRAATATNARLVGLEGKVGRVASGHLADLVVLAGDPLTDVSAARRVRAVYQEGRQVVQRSPESWIA